MISRAWIEWLNARDAMSPGDTLKELTRRHGRWATWLVPAIYLGCLIAFIADLASANTTAFGVFYAPLIVTAVFYNDKSWVWILTTIACVMNIVGAFLPVIAGDVPALIENRTLSILALLATAAFTWHARTIQDQLNQQTERAEAAEQIKTDVLTNVSQEIRAPLYAMIGMLELMTSESRPDDKTALGIVRSSARRLVTTINNLVDLTQFSGRILPAEAIDLGTLSRQIAEANLSDAVGRQIGLTINIPADADTVVMVNPWAARRILENKIADAIVYTPPGGRIEVSTITEQDHCSAVIITTGMWPPAALRSASDPDTAPLVPSTMGLALSQRLAQAMGARLVFSNEPGEGTTVRLRLPRRDSEV